MNPNITLISKDSEYITEKGENCNKSNENISNFNTKNIEHEVTPNNAQTVQSNKSSVLSSSLCKIQTYSVLIILGK